MPTDPEPDTTSTPAPIVAAPSEVAPESEEPAQTASRPDRVDDATEEAILPTTGGPAGETVPWTPDSMSNQLPALQPPTASLVTPNEPAGPGAVVGQVVLSAVQHVVRAVRPEAAVAVATQFTFPLALALAVVGYLIVQGLVDRRDPKLRMAPQHAGETYLTFVAEEQL
jgi:hypothetical protein